MFTILIGQVATFRETVARDGAPVALDPASVVTARLYDAKGVAPLGAALTLSHSDTGADWSNGVVVGSFDAVATGALAAGSAMLVVASSLPGLVKRFAVSIEAAGVAVQSALFVRDIVVDELRADRLLLAAATIAPGLATASDDFLWGKILAAESEIRHRLRVPLVPTMFFPLQPTGGQVAALNGMPWEIDIAQDYGPEMFQGERWGFMVTRWKPLQSVVSIRFAYPSPTVGIFDVPTDWIRFDPKYGHIRLIPASSANVAPLNAFILMALGGGRTVPFMVQVTYVAGLANAAVEYPELLDAIKKTAVLKMIQDSFLPGSGSISADGLSQSMSVDMAAYGAIVDTIIDGPKGSNGGLMTAIHGIRAGFLGL